MSALIEVEGCQDDHPGAARAGTQLGGGCDPIHPRHPDVHQDDVRAGLFKQLQPSTPIVGLTDDAHVVMGIQDHPEPRHTDLPRDAREISGVPQLRVDPRGGHPANEVGQIGRGLGRGQGQHRVSPFVIAGAEHPDQPAHIHPDAGRSGWGRRLFATPLAAARATGLRHIDASIGADHSPALAHYSAMGFTPCPEEGDDLSHPFDV